MLGKPRDLGQGTESEESSTGAGSKILHDLPPWHGNAKKKNRRLKGSKSLLYFKSLGTPTRVGAFVPPIHYTRLTGGFILSPIYLKTQSVFLFRDLNLSRRGWTSWTFPWTLKRRTVLSHFWNEIWLHYNPADHTVFPVGQRCAKLLIEESIHLCIAGGDEKPALASSWQEESDKAIELGQASGGTT